MVNDIKKKLDRLNCNFSNKVNNTIIHEDYGINICKGDKIEDFNLESKYFKIQSDFLNHYKDFTELELKVANLTVDKKLNKIKDEDQDFYSTVISILNSSNLINTSNQQTQKLLQTNPSTVWSLVHNLGYAPIINIFDLYGNELVGYTRNDFDNNIINIIFDTPTSGTLIVK